ncbi:sensor histidine kinase [Streptomyces sp. cf124]|uniref:sensor histidine kinase n=1 Tax=Streptomyces sp. cf124 TaxID=1761903 RepID=UPI0015A615AC|nr:histidine kinase [Streptomyces sp. cf124]
MKWNLTRIPDATRLITISGLVAFALTWTVELATIVSRPEPFANASNWLPVLVSGPLIALAGSGLPRSIDLRGRIACAVLLSLTVTVWSLIAPPDPRWWGALESCGLFFLTVRAAADIRRPATALAYTAVLCATVLLLPLRAASLGVFVAGGYVLTVALAICVAIGCALRALESRRERAVRDVRQAERLAIARDLHDLIAHHMTGIIVQANAALTIQTTAPDQVPPLLRNIASSGTETLESMRRLVRVLREDNHAALRTGDLVTELADLVSAHCASGGDDTVARVEVAAAARTARLSPEVELAVQRLVQEALTNVRRHAPGARTTVQLDADSAGLLVDVTNTAPVRHAATPTGGRGGFGLLGVRERVEALDGTFRVGPVPHGGWQVHAVFPLVAADAVRDSDQSAH